MNWYSAFFSSALYFSIYLLVTLFKGKPQSSQKNRILEPSLLQFRLDKFSSYYFCGVRGFHNVDGEIDLEKNYCEYFVALFSIS